MKWIARIAAVAALTPLLATSVACARIEGLAEGMKGRLLGEDEARVAPADEIVAVDVSGTVVWDGRPSLGGAWVAHPDVSEPQRVRIVRASNGASVEGWLFRRDRPESGPDLQISSQAASELGIDANEPVPLRVEAAQNNSDG